MARVPEYVKVLDTPLGRRYQVRVETTDGDGVRHQSKRRFDNLKDAVDYHSGVTSDRSRGVYVGPKDLTLRKAADDWLAGQRITIKTRSAYVTALRPYVDALGDRRVQDITKADIESVVTALRDGTSAMGSWNAPTKKTKLAKKVRSQWAASAINASLSKMRAVFTDLMAQGMVVRNPADLVKPLKTTKPDPNTLSAAEAELLLSATVGDPLHIAWWLAIYGVRRGENGGLRWDAVDLTAGTLLITEARLATPGGSSFAPPKTLAGVRTLPLPADLHAALRAEHRRQLQLQLLLGNKWPNSGMVVVGALGTPPHPDTVTHTWNKTLERLKIPHVRLHDARHTCATLMHLNNVPESAIAAWLGHTDPRFTLATYARIKNDAAVLESAGNSLSAAMHPPRSGNAKSG